MTRRGRRGHEVSISLFAFQDIIAAVTGVALVITLLLTLALLEQKPLADENAGDVQQLVRQRDELAGRVQKLEEVARSSVAQPLLSKAQLQQHRVRLAHLQRQVEASEQRAAQLEATLAQARERLQVERVREQENAEALARAERELHAAPVVTLLGGHEAAKTALLVELVGDEVLVGELDRERQPRMRWRRGGDSADEAFLEWALQRSPEQEYFVLLVHSNAVDRFHHLRRQLEQSGFEVGWDIVVHELPLLTLETGGPSDGTTEAR